jgi:hypothetical protein
MELFINRTEYTQHSTVGNLYVKSTDLKPRCFTLEDAYREVAGQPVSTWKVPGRTAIPAGRYEVIINWSDRFKRQMPLLLNVPGFEGVRIHVGNSDKDVEGCIALGGTHDRPDFIGDSHQAWGLFYIELQSYTRYEKVYLTIKSVNPPTAVAPKV